MKPILDKLFTGNKTDAYEYILKEYYRKSRVIVNYLYFANITGKHLFDKYKTLVDKTIFQDALKDDYKILSPSIISPAYKKALLESDILLPDGIALQLFYRMAAKRKKISTKKERLDNLNWTDFWLFFIDRLQSEKWKDNVELYLYGTYPGILEKTKLFLQERWFSIAYSQDGFSNFDRDQVSEIRKKNKKQYAVLLVARTTPEYPIQELRAWSNQDKITKNKLMVFNQWGTFDFWAGIQKRAPKLRRRYKIEWLRRLITDPKRNYKKVIDTALIIKYIFSHLLLKNK